MNNEYQRVFEFICVDQFYQCDIQIETRFELFEILFFFLQSSKQAKQSNYETMISFIAELYKHELFIIKSSH
jgi:hypothetical protein